jgi:hypothetical protein
MEELELEMAKSRGLRISPAEEGGSLVEVEASGDSGDVSGTTSRAGGTDTPSTNAQISFLSFEVRPGPAAP